MSDKLNLAEIEQRAKRTERRLIDAGLDHTITDDIFALLACVATPTPPTTPAAAALVEAAKAYAKAYKAWRDSVYAEDWPDAAEQALHNAALDVAAQEPTP